MVIEQVQTSGGSSVQSFRIPCTGVNSIHSAANGADFVIFEDGGSRKIALIDVNLPSSSYVL